MLRHGVDERLRQLQPVGGVEGPVAQLHVQVPPGVGPGGRHQPGAAVVQQTAAGPRRRGQLVDLCPIEVLDLFVGQRNEALRIVAVPPGAMGLFELRQLLRIEAPHRLSGLREGSRIGEGVGTAYDQRPMRSGAEHPPGGRGAAPFEQGLPAEGRPAALPNLRFGVRAVVASGQVAASELLPQLVTRGVPVFGTELPREVPLAPGGRSVEYDAGTFGRDIGPPVDGPRVGRETPRGLRIPQVETHGSRADLPDRMQQEVADHQAAAAVNASVVRPVVVHRIVADVDAQGVRLRLPADIAAQRAVAQKRSLVPRLGQAVPDHVLTGEKVLPVDLAEAAGGRAELRDPKQKFCKGRKYISKKP